MLWNVSLYEVTGDAGVPHPPVVLGTPSSAGASDAPSSMRTSAGQLMASGSGAAGVVAAVVVSVVVAAVVVVVVGGVVGADVVVDVTTVGSGWNRATGELSATVTVSPVMVPATTRATMAATKTRNVTSESRMDMTAFSPLHWSTLPLIHAAHSLPETLRKMASSSLSVSEGTSDSSLDSSESAPRFIVARRVR